MSRRPTPFPVLTAAWFAGTSWGVAIYPHLPPAMFSAGLACVAALLAYENLTGVTPLSSHHETGPLEN